MPDNSNLASKLALRRYFLDKYHSKDSILVLDCCCGSRVIWDNLSQDYRVIEYLPLDVKRDTKSIHMDSVRFIRDLAWHHNIVDVDTYGSPWKHWLALIRKIHRPTSVFLTVFGHVCIGVDRSSLTESLGLAPLKVPIAILLKLAPMAINALLFSASKYCTLTEVAEIESGNANIRYLGVHLLPQK